MEISDIQRYDSTKMYETYDNWASIAKKNYEQNFDQIDFKNLDHIVFSGMGGSGSINDVFSAIFSKTDKHISIVKGYELPKTTDKETLVICTSVSGNTTETLSVLKSAKKTNCKTLSFSSGGLIEKYCIKNSLEFRKIPMYKNPRTSFTSFLYGMLKTLEQILPLKKSDMNKSINSIRLLTKKIGSHNLTENNPSLSLAKWISKTPIIYYPYGLQSVAVRFKNSLQENAKNHAMIENIIETSHNGIVAWEDNSRMKPILIQGKDDHIKTKQRWRIFKQYFKERNIDFYEVGSVNGDILTKSVNLVYLLDYSSIYLAFLKKIDPSLVKSIEYVKEKL